MTLINIRNLGVTLSAPLFSRLNLIVNAGDRIGLVANGLVPAISHSRKLPRVVLQFL